MLKYLGRGADVSALDDKGNTPLHAYVERQDKNKLECLMAFLINASCDVNAVNGGGESPLHLACEVRFQCVWML